MQQYWSKFPGVYLTGDSAKRDKDGYYWIIGRVDDVIKVSGYRLGTAEVEIGARQPPGRRRGRGDRAAARDQGPGHPRLRAAAPGLRGVARAGGGAAHSTSASEMGPIAKPEDVKFVDSLPKTRSGKIMRRVLKARAQGLPEGDISTLEE